MNFIYMCGPWWLNQASVQPHIQEYKGSADCTSGKEKNKRTQSYAGRGNGFILEELGEGDDYDQKTLYKFVSELVKIRERLMFYFCLSICTCGYMCGCHPCVDVHRGQKRVFDPLELQL